MDQPTKDLYLEDFTPGQVFEFGQFTVSEAEIIEFAQRYDPQPFHIDPELAKESIYGGVIASGWHTVSMTMRMMVDGYINRTHSMGSPGVDSVRWVLPVRPGDTLSVRLTVRENRPSTSKPDRGVILSTIELRNQTGAVAMTMESIGMMKRRPETK